MGFVIATIAAVSFLLVWAGLTRPAPVSRPQAEKDSQYRLKELRGLGFLACAVEDLASWINGPGDDRAWNSGLNERSVRRLKQADWYWAPGEAAPPTPTAPFWNLETLWAAKVLHAVLFALGGLALGGVPALLFKWNPVVALAAAALGAVAGFFDPDRELAEAAENRRRQIILEMGYKVPELRSYVRVTRSLAAALRFLTQRPGGPFVRELHRVITIYDITSHMSRGLQAVIDHNAECEPLVNMCGDLLAILDESGEIGVVLEAHADAALHEQRRLLRQQGQDNTQSMSYVVAGTTLVVIFLLVAGPALWIVVNTL